MPVRKIPKSYQNVTGIAAHSKADGPAGFESTLERDFLTLLEFDTKIDRFEVQPVTLDWIDSAGKPHQYTPDVLATVLGRRRQKMLYEVKYRAELREKWPELRPKFRAAIRFARVQGWLFKIMTEVEIRTPYLDNAKFLLPFQRQGPVEEAHMTLLSERLDALRHTTPAELLAASFQDPWNQARLLPTLWYLISTRQIGINLSAKLTMASPIWSLGR